MGAACRWSRSGQKKQVAGEIKPEPAQNGPAAQHWLLERLLRCTVKKCIDFFYNNTPTYRCEPKVRLLIFSKNFFRTLSNHFPQWTYSIQTGKIRLYQHITPLRYRRGGGGKQCIMQLQSISELLSAGIKNFSKYSHIIF